MFYCVPTFLNAKPNPLIDSVHDHHPQTEAAVQLLAEEKGLGIRPDIPIFAPFSFSTPSPLKYFNIVKKGLNLHISYTKFILCQYKLMHSV